MKVGYTTGVFDLFHIGHLNLLSRAKNQCDKLIVGVTTDELCQDLKGKLPVIPFEERIQIVEAIRYVDEVVAQNKIDEIGDWERLAFNIIFKGSDWKGSEKWISWQFRTCYDFESGLMTKGTFDELTAAARLYEATRLKNYRLNAPLS